MEQYEIQELAERPWKETFDVLTADMDPESIDICKLADRYRNYIGELQDFDLEVPARAIRLLSALLRIKTLALTDGYVDEPQEEENPMDFEEDELIEEDEIADTGPGLELGPDLKVPVKPKPKRRMSKRELKGALEDAMEVKQRREERQEERQQIDQHFEVDEKSLEEKVNSLFSRVTDLVSRKSSEKVPFNSLLEENDNKERIEKFLHVLHLENERKVKCIQENWLEELKVKPHQEEVPN